MNKFFLDLRTDKKAETEKQKETRLFVIIDSRFYWAIEWCHEHNDEIVITDLNAGFLSAAVEEGCVELEQTTPELLRERYGLFADYIERSVSGFRSYIHWIHPDPESASMRWELHRVK